MKFTEEAEDDNEVDEVIETVSSTWVLPDKKKCYWPPVNISSARAGRMAILHAVPNPDTWQLLPITFVNSYSKFLLFYNFTLVTFFFIFFF